MTSDPRITAAEAAAIHASAVTRNYSVEPRLGGCRLACLKPDLMSLLLD